VEGARREHAPGNWSAAAGLNKTETPKPAWSAETCGICAGVGPDFPVSLNPGHGLTLLGLLLIESRGAFRRQAAALGGKGLAPRQLPVPGGGTACKSFPAVGPIAQPITVPGRLHVERIEIELLHSARACSMYSRVGSASGAMGYLRVASTSMPEIGRFWSVLRALARLRDAARYAHPRSDWCGRRVTTGPRPCWRGRYLR